MEDVKMAADTFEEVAKLAKKIHELNEAGIVINISGIGCPDVLLTKQGFDALFPLGVEPELRQSDDGTCWKKYEVEACGVRWVCWEQDNV